MWNVAFFVIVGRCWDGDRSSTTESRVMRRSSVSDRTPFKNETDTRASTHQGSILNSRTSHSGIKRPSINSRQSGIPLVTPQQLFKATNQAAHHSRGSIAKNTPGQGRVSYSRELKKDVRPINDKSYQSRCIRSLLDFFTNRDYPYRLDTKVLMSPTNKDFSNMFEFLYRAVEPNFIMPTKLEEDCPRLLKNLGFPYSLQKSAFSAVGNRISWPSLLAALNWMKDYVEYTELCRSQFEQLAFPPENENNSEFMQEQEALYKHFEDIFLECDGFDEIDDREKEIAEKLVIQQFPYDDSDIQLNYRRFKGELQELESQEDAVEKLVKENSAIKSDIKGLDDYLDKFQHHIAVQENEDQQLVSEIEDLKISCSKQQEEIEDKKKQVKACNMSKHDVDRMKKHLDDLRQHITKNQKEIDDSENDFNDLQTEVATMTSAVEEECIQFNEIYQRIVALLQQLNPAINLPSDFELRVNFSQRQHLAWLNEVKPAFLKYKNMIMQKIEDIQDECVDFEELIHQLSSETSNKKQGLLLLDSKARNRQLEMNELKDQIKTDREMKECELSSLNTKLSKFSEENKSQELRLLKLQKKISEAELRSNSAEVALKEFVAEGEDFVKKICDAILNHFSQLEARKMQFVQTCANVVQKVEDRQKFF